MKIFLIGGGWRAETFPETYGRFLKAAERDGERRIAVVVAREPETAPRAQFMRFFEALETAGLDASEAFETIVSKDKPLTGDLLERVNPTGVFVCGGLTPAYHEALCADPRWLEHLRANEIPYGGFSAGAAVASATAIVGGWRRETGGKTIQIADENAGEDLDLLDVRSGLGLVDFAVDVHATQWGTLTRLAHAVDSEKVDEGWAIDENTMLEIEDGDVRVSGAGSAYRVTRRNGKMSIEIFQAAD